MKETLTAVKARLGPLVFLDLTAYDLVTAHRKLGEQVRPAVLGILRRKLEGGDAPVLAQKIRQGRACRARLEHMGTDERLDERVRSGLAEYLDCLSAWSEGAALEGFAHPHLAAAVDGQRISALDLALFLQNDNVGCQTGLYRLADGSVILWHAEEDVTEGRFDKLRIAEFSLPGGPETVHLKAFIYPDLLPGPSFAWRSDGYAQAIDTILLKSPPALPQGMLANVAAWLALRLGPAWAGGDWLEALSPFYDGYALNVLYHRHGQAHGVKFEFAAGHILPYTLQPEAGNWLFQVNIFCQRENRALRAIENLSLRSTRFYERRMQRTAQELDARPPALSAGDEMAFFYRLLASRAGGEAAYANSDVMAHFVLRLAPGEMEAWVGAGPAFKRGRPVVDRLRFNGRGGDPGSTG
jgi:hypothetical protein